MSQRPKIATYGDQGNNYYGQMNPGVDNSNYNYSSADPGNSAVLQSNYTDDSSQAQYYPFNFPSSAAQQPSQTNRGVSLLSLTGEPPPPPPPPKSFKKINNGSAPSSSWLDSTGNSSKQTIGGMLACNYKTFPSSGLDNMRVPAERSQGTNDALNPRSDINRSDQRPFGAEFSSPGILYENPSVGNHGGRSHKEKSVSLKRSVTNARESSQNNTSGNIHPLKATAPVINNANEMPCHYSNESQASAGPHQSNYFQNSQANIPPSSASQMRPPHSNPYNANEFGFTGEQTMGIGFGYQTSQVDTMGYQKSHSNSLGYNDSQSSSVEYGNSQSSSMGYGNSHANSVGYHGYAEGYDPNFVKNSEFQSAGGTHIGNNTAGYPCDANDGYSTNAPINGPNSKQTDGYDPACPLDSSYGDPPAAGHHQESAASGWPGGRNANYYTDNSGVTIDEQFQNYDCYNNSNTQSNVGYPSGNLKANGGKNQSNNGPQIVDDSAAPMDWEDMRYIPGGNKNKDQRTFTGPCISNAISADSRDATISYFPDARVKTGGNTEELKNKRTFGKQPAVTQNQEKGTEPPKKMDFPPAVPVFVNVSNIPRGVPDSLLQRMFQICGAEEDWQRAKKSVGSLQNFGFCKFSDLDSVLRALRLLDGWTFNNGPLKVQVSEHNKRRLIDHLNSVRVGKRLLDTNGNIPPPDKQTKSSDTAFRQKLLQAVHEELGMDEICGIPSEPSSDAVLDAGLPSGLSSNDDLLESPDVKQNLKELQAKERKKLSEEFKRLAATRVASIEEAGKLDFIINAEMHIIKQDEPDLAAPFCGLCNRDHDWDIRCSEAVIKESSGGQKPVELMPDEVRRLLSSVQNILNTDSAVPSEQHTGGFPKGLSLQTLASQPPNEAIQRALANLQPSVLSSVMAQTASPSSEVRSPAEDPRDTLDTLAQPMVAPSMKSFLSQPAAESDTLPATSVAPPDQPASFDPLDTVLQLMLSQLPAGDCAGAGEPGGEGVRLALLNELIESRQRARETEAKQAELASLVTKMKQGQDRIETLSSSVKKARAFRESDVADWPDMAQMMQQADSVDLVEEARTLSRIRETRHGLNVQPRYGASLTPAEPWQGIPKHKAGLAHPVHARRPDAVIPKQSYAMDVSVLERYTKRFQEVDSSSKPSMVDASRQIPLGIRIKSGIMGSLDSPRVISPVQRIEPTANVDRVDPVRSRMHVSPLSSNSSDCAASDDGESDVKPIIDPRQPGMMMNDLSPEEMEKRLDAYKSQVFSTLKKSWNSRGGGRQIQSRVTHNRSRSPRRRSPLRSRSRSARSRSNRRSPVSRSTTSRQSPKFERRRPDVLKRRSTDRAHPTRSSPQRRRYSPSITRNSRDRRRSHGRSRSPSRIDRYRRSPSGSRRKTPPSLFSRDIVKLSPTDHSSRRASRRHSPPTDNRRIGDNKSSIRAFSPPDYYIDNAVGSRSSNKNSRSGRRDDRDEGRKYIKTEKTDENFSKPNKPAAKQRLSQMEMASAMASLPPELLQKVWKFNLPLDAILNKDPAELKAHISKLESSESQNSAELAANELFKAFQRISKEDASEPDVVQVPSMFGIGQKSSSGDVILIDDSELQAAPVIKVRKTDQLVDVKSESPACREDLRKLLNSRKDSSGVGGSKESNRDEEVNDVTLSYEGDDPGEDGDVLKVDDDGDNEGAMSRYVTTKPRLLNLFWT